MTRFLFTLACLGVVGTASAAEPARTSLAWVRLAGAESCIGPKALALAVEGRLARPVFVSAAEAELQLEGHVEPEKTGFKAHVTLSKASGSK
jgi:hypothetical protein